MLPNKSYLVRAFYDWIVDSKSTPYIVVDTTVDFVEVPQDYIENNQIVLNALPHAIRNMVLLPTHLSFDATFAGKIVHIYVPVVSIVAIYAKENGRGMVFNADNQEDADHPMLVPMSRKQAEGGGDGSGGGSSSHLRVVK